MWTMGQSFSWWCVRVEHATRKLAGRALSNPGGEPGHVEPRDVVTWCDWCVTWAHSCTSNMHPGTLCFISQRDGACHETTDLATKYLICIASIKNSHLSLREACGDFVLDSSSSFLLCTCHSQDVLFWRMLPYLSSHVGPLAS